MSRSTLSAYGFAVVMGLAALSAPASAQDASADPGTVAPSPEQATAPIVNAPFQVFGVPVQVAAPDPVAYIGSAYQTDISGQSESNADPALTESLRGTAPNGQDAW